MKKVLFLLLATGMLIQPTYAAVTQETNKIELSATMLKENFDAYSIKFNNTGNNAIKISNISSENVVNNANQILVAEAMQRIKKNNKYGYMGIVTLGIGNLVQTSKNSTALSEQKAALAEAATFIQNFEQLKSEIILPNDALQFKVLIPKGSEPNLQAVFQDTKTNEYIKAK